MLKYFILFLYLTVSGIYDLIYKKVPGKLIFSFAAILALSLILTGSFKPDVLSLLPGFFIVFISLVTGGLIGIADGATFLICGMVFNSAEIFSILFCSFFICSICGLFIFLKTRNRHYSLPFIPFILISSIICIILR